MLISPRNQKFSNSNSRATNQCQSAIKQAITTITKGRQIKVNIESFNFAEEYKTHIPHFKK